MKDLRKLNVKKINLYEIKSYFNISEYGKLYEMVCFLVDKNIIKPVKAKGRNGMKPALFNEYHVIKEEIDYSKYIEEIHYSLNPSINTSYYLKNMDKYIKDRKYILMLSKFLDNDKEQLNIEISKNERSFQIWNEEKFLAEGGGERLLKNLGFDISFLTMYETSEPLAYYSINKNVPQNILIVENKDTFYSIRKYMIEGEENLIFGKKISTVIYGSGKKIYKSFGDFRMCGEPYFFNKDNKFLYFGDLDYEGIGIYEGIYELFKDNVEIELFKEAYIFMIEKYEKNFIELPSSKEGQNRNIKDIFLNNFCKIHRNKISDILVSGKYIPQEIINIKDIMENCNAV
ncbi:MAG TPA: hypothetical protein DC034_08060 [Clostridium sp.]|jgi:DNA-binding cell septation regulator SpoVG|nr:hypothetical protein [Clostridium sp.]